MTSRRLHRSPSQILVAGLAVLIALGTALLLLPQASSGPPLSVVNALFTATSAVCVTGLVVVDTPVDLSVFGQLVVLLLIQVGGLGYMTISSVLALAIGRQLSVHERITLQEALNIETMDGLMRFTLTVLTFTLVLEAIGAVVLTAAWWGEFGPGRAAYLGLFHSVSAFNNAGFALFSDNLMQFRGDWIVTVTIMALVVCGGAGFVVLAELRSWRPGKRVSVQTRLVVTLSGLLLLAGTVFVFLLERGNPRTLAGLPLAEAWLASMFQAVTPRTAGFNTLDIGALTPATLFGVMILMFIGAAPGSTGGGVKVTTFGITLAALWATVRGNQDASLFRRRLSPALVARAFLICLIAFLAVNAVATVLLVVEGRDLLPTLFEVTSAFGTVGLSTGEGSVVSLAGHFSSAGKLCVATMMFMGRIGPLTLAVAVAHRRTRAAIRYPEARILVG
ncbi:MAG: Trk family potassium uptake protein [Acidimicrobiia bacterium]|nr:Trk family potassium uptake protein [Acidimicrobiia bacterium]